MRGTNFASRMRLGRLSPQGAMMVFEAAFVGVLVPRGMPGRGTAVDDKDVPVEFQGYWTPDPRRAQKKNNIEDLVILDRLRAVVKVTFDGLRSMPTT